MRHAVALVLLVTAVSVLGACSGGSSASGPTSPPATSPTLSGPTGTATGAPRSGELIARWQPVQDEGRHHWPVSPYLDLAGDGTWSSSDGCNTTRGTWAMSADGGLTVTAGPTTMIACENVPVARSFATAATVRGDADQIILVDDAGQTLLILERAPSGAQMTHGPVRPS
jgi:heat shock protein HslJ